MNAITRFGSILLIAMSAPGAVAATACSAKSGASIPTVVELYTSEGCDSCPPADRWFSTLKADAQSGKLVPLAFHVDYWDYIGWKDRFGDARFGVRHREAAARGGAKVVYTPQVFADGREYQFWRKPAAAKPGGKAAGGKNAAAGAGGPNDAKASRTELALTATPTGSTVKLSVTGAGAAGGRNASAYVALYENGISSDVTAGENRGVQLQHDFVVRRWLGPFAFESGKLNLATDVSVPTDGVMAQSGIAVVAVDERGGVLQALAMPLRECGG